MMTLELEYFFLCSGWGHASHSPPRAGPQPPILGPREDGAEARAAALWPLVAARKASRLQQNTALLPCPGRPLSLGTACRLGVRRGGGAGPPSAVWLASPHPANCQLTSPPSLGSPAFRTGTLSKGTVSWPGPGQSWGADAWRSAPRDQVAAGGRAELIPTPLPPNYQRGGRRPPRVPFPCVGRSAGWGLWGWPKQPG